VKSRGAGVRIKAWGKEGGLFEKGNVGTSGAFKKKKIAGRWGPRGGKGV